ncbi:hypothetical protein [Nostoc sp. UHCC 0251]|uniref:hypothetical protein n=1 Tax=Nostoc sp. UHCC 0251 TaxID=3110240 RepID=UPI002B1E9D45|nr:hypothetical protein [Nostoc sp. UHCC 0251]MEA5623260.1 hypothetical protein [Nostoc sp. UHCC 0251]
MKLSSLFRQAVNPQHAPQRIGVVKQTEVNIESPFSRLAILNYWRYYLELLFIFILGRDVEGFKNLRISAKRSLYSIVEVISHWSLVISHIKFG